ncbi:hypothetical protein [Nocardioides sp. Iso805N]|uniref:hypothetical protein n=1 Tax=Nocardioides sp. Iso805N TaxID=1283287 RepID=UPI0003811FE8|nr:hypothetical protein [Nocardioides sp. Iso805N]
MALDNTQKARLTVAAVAVQAAIAAVTIRDINRRPKAGVRGPKAIWRLLGSVNTLGSAAYWVIGRKRTAPAVLVSQES